MPAKSITYYLSDVTAAQVEYFDNLDAYELLEWATALSQQALDARNAELTRPLDLSVLQPDFTVEMRGGTAVIVIPDEGDDTN